MSIISTRTFSSKKLATLEYSHKTQPNSHVYSKYHEYLLINITNPEAYILRSVAIIRLVLTTERHQYLQVQMSTQVKYSDETLFVILFYTEKTV